MLVVKPNLGISQCHNAFHSNHVQKPLVEHTVCAIDRSFPIIPKPYTYDCLAVWQKIPLLKLGETTVAIDNLHFLWFQLLFGGFSSQSPCPNGPSQSCGPKRRNILVNLVLVIFFCFWARAARFNMGIYVC